MIRSFLSALAGWIAAIVGLPVAGYLNARTIDHLSWNVIGGSAYLGAVFVIPVWLCILWPLYVLVPFSSVLWRPYFCIPCGTIAGALILWLVVPSFFELPLHPYFYVAPFVGTVTCAVGCTLKYTEKSVSLSRQRAS